jgi:ABC-type nitrate/sulfonate/bicarbonate transport system substrate-binding protein
VAVSGVLLALLLACSPGPAAGGRAPAAAESAAGGASPPAAPIPVRNAWTTISASTVPWWLALEAGYFREQGLAVELQFIEPGAPLLAALNSGEVDIVSAGAPSLVLGNLQGLETMIFGAVTNVLDITTVVRPEVTSAEQMRGKTVAVSRLKAVTDVGARLGLQRLGLQPDVDFFTRGAGGIAESLAALEAGAVDGAAVSVPTLFEARKRGYRELASTADMGIPFLGNSAGATRASLAAHPEVGEPYLRALAQAIARLRTDRELGIAVIGKYTKTEDRDMLNATIDHYLKQFLVDPYPDPASLQGVLDIEEHPGARTAKPEDFTDYRFADALRRSGFLDKLPR